MAYERVIAHLKKQRTKAINTRARRIARKDVALEAKNNAVTAYDDAVTSVAVAQANIDELDAAIAYLEGV